MSYTCPMQLTHTLGYMKDAQVRQSLPRTSGRSGRQRKGARLVRFDIFTNSTVSECEETSTREPRRSPTWLVGNHDSATANISAGASGVGKAHSPGDIREPSESGPHV